MIKLSVIVVTWNCKMYLEEFVDSLGDELTDREIEIIVVDNASTDGTVEFIQKKLPGIDLVQNVKNVGFARANNVGLSRARGELLCLVNPDVRLVSGCLKKMIEFMGNDESIGLLGPRMLGGDGLVHRSTMRFPTLWNQLCRALAVDALVPQTRLLGGYLMQDFRHAETMEVEVLNGWFWLTRRSAVDQVGGLDERFFMYGEDIDWCRRFRDAGWKCVYFAGAEAIHYGGGSSSNAPVRFYVEKQRANLQYFAKYHGPLGQCGFVACMWLHNLLRVLGYSLKSVLFYQHHQETVHKVSRSLTSIRWLLGYPIPGASD